MSAQVSLSPNGPPTSIVLNMIVRNEAGVIERCLASVIDNIDAAVIVDTGSTDDTVGLIRRFFAEHRPDLPMEISSEPWKNFGENRNSAFAKAQAFVETLRFPAAYYLLMDADMVLEGTIDKEQLQHPWYSILQRQQVFTIPNVRLIRHVPVENRQEYGNWQCVGVTHEAWRLEPPESKGKVEIDDIQPTLLLLGGVSIVDHDDGGSKADKFVRDICMLENYLEYDNPSDSRATLYLGISYAQHGLLRKEQENDLVKEKETADMELRKLNPMNEVPLDSSGQKVLREWRSPIDPLHGNAISMVTEKVPQNYPPGYAPATALDQVVREYTEEEYLRLFGSLPRLRSEVEAEEAQKLLAKAGQSAETVETAAEKAAETVETAAETAAESVAETVETAAETVAETVGSAAAAAPAKSEAPGVETFEQSLWTKSADMILRKAIEWLSIRINMGKIEKDPSNEEVWYAKLLIGKVHQALGNKQDAVYWYLDALNTRPHRNESLIALSKFYFSNASYYTGKMFADMATQRINAGEDGLFIEHDAYIFDPWIQAMSCVTGTSESANVERCKYLEYLLRRPFRQAVAIDNRAETRLQSIESILFDLLPNLPCTQSSGDAAWESSQTDYFVHSVWPTLLTYYRGDLLSEIPMKLNHYLPGWFCWNTVRVVSQQHHSDATGWTVLTKADAIRFVKLILFFRDNIDNAPPTMCVVERVSIPYRLPDNGRTVDTQFQLSSDGDTMLIRLVGSGGCLSIPIASLCFDEC